MVKKIEKSRISKKSMYLIILTLVLLGGFFFYSYNSSTKINKNTMIKKELYKSTLCQYSCPLVEQTIGGKLQLFPNRSCISGCIENLKSSRFVNESFNIKDLLNDSLVREIKKVVVNCKNESISNNVINNTDFFRCSRIGLASLKKDYAYLN